MADPSEEDMVTWEAGGKLPAAARRIRWAFVCKPDVERAVKIAREVFAFLRRADQEVAVEERIAHVLGVPGTPLSRLRGDVVITVGGDGTMLMTLANVKDPIFAINSGAVGFLAEVEPKYALAGVQRVMEGDYHVEERTKLSVTLNGERLPDAANEVAVQSAKIAKLIKFQLYVDDEFVDTMRGDGVLVATATGSTGYAMSLGGPILDPTIDAAVIVPVAPFRMANRPLIVPLEKTIRIRLVPRHGEFRGKDAKVVVDGQNAYGIPLEGEIVITKSANVSRFVRFGGGFYERVRTKLMR